SAYTAPVIAGMEKGFVFLYQKCVHLGCRVPNCPTSQWFECPCHGSQYNRVGEKKGGPAPRGLDRFTPEFSGEVVTVHTSTAGKPTPPLTSIGSSSSAARRCSRRRATTSPR